MVPRPSLQDSKVAIDELTRAFFQSFTPGRNGKVDLNIIRRIFIPEGLIIKTCGPAPEVYNLQQFIEPREKMLNDGTLSGFGEQEIAERTDIFGDIACRFSIYRKWGSISGQEFAASGMKTIHFIRTAEGWKMCSLIWDDERAGLDIPGGYARGEWSS